MQSKQLEVSRQRLDIERERLEFERTTADRILTAMTSLLTARNTSGIGKAGDASVDCVTSAGDAQAAASASSDAKDEQ